MTEISHSDVSFASFGKNFQEKIIQALLTDTLWAQQMMEVMRPEYFELKYLRYLFERYSSYYAKYKTFPTIRLLVTIVKDDLKSGNDEILCQQIVEYLHRTKTNPDIGDLQYVKDRSLDFCKKQALKEALVDAVELIATEKYESVVERMKKAVVLGEAPSAGHDFFEDMETRFVKINRLACPTGISVLDEKNVLNGGLGRGEFGVVVANTGVGKSHVLVQLGANALRLGKNVLHYTFELSETAVALRYDSNLTGIASHDIVDNKEDVIAHYEDNDEYGRLIIKEYPTNYASSITLRNHIDKLTLKGFKPGVILIDYADIMRSTRQYDSLRHELKLIYEELRCLAGELNIPIWTASQANKEASNSEVVGLENMSEAYGKAMVCDFVLTLSRKPMEKETGYGKMFIAKNRAGKDGIAFPIHLDTARSTLVVTDTEKLSLTEARFEDEKFIKKALRETLKSIDRDPSVEIRNLKRTDKGEDDDDGE